VLSRNFRGHRERDPSASQQAPELGSTEAKARLEKVQPRVNWPAASTFGNILHRAGLTNPKQKKRRTTPCSEPFSEVTAPNQLWCMDFKDYFSTGDGTRCDPFTITDAHSRYLIRCQTVSRMDLSQVVSVCEAAMREYGMPARIRTDNGAPFAGTGLLGLSKLSLSWTKMGTADAGPDEGISQTYMAIDRDCRSLVNKRADPIETVAACKKVADEADRFAPQSHFITRRAAYVFYTIALIQAKKSQDALTVGDKAVAVVLLGHDDGSGSSAAYSVRAQAKALADRGVRTVIVVDGLDHVSREEKPDRSFLREFPLPIAVPPGVLFVLGSQKLELPDISTSVRDQAATGGRLIKIAPLTRGAVNRLAELAEIATDVDREKLYSKTEGHPLSTRYVLDGLKRAADDRERKAWLDSGPDYGGDVDVFYRRALHDIEGNDSAQAGLAYLALAEGSIGLPSLDHAIGRSAVDGLIRAAGYLLKVDRNRSASIFHNSFRLFLRAELFVRHGARDEDRIRTLYGELASMAKNATEGDPQQWMELRYRSSAGDFQTVAALATATAFREQFQLGRSSQEIRNDLSVCFRAVAELRNPKLLLEVIFASHELNMRVQNLGDEVFDALIALGDLEYAKRMLLGAVFRGTRDEVALKFVIADKEMQLKGYSRRVNFCW
jgi:hypothetical protein